MAAQIALAHSDVVDAPSGVLATEGASNGHGFAGPSADETA